MIPSESVVRWQRLITGLSNGSTGVRILGLPRKPQEKQLMTQQEFDGLKPGDVISRVGSSVMADSYWVVLRHGNRKENPGILSTVYIVECVWSDIPSTSRPKVYEFGDRSQAIYPDLWFIISSSSSPVRAPAL